MSEPNDKLILNKHSVNVEVSSGRTNKKVENHELEEISKLVPKNEPITPMQEINKAYEVSKFGRFHVKLLVVTFFGIIASSLVTNTTSYLLPIAECDLNMNLKQKGLLTAMPFFGMLVSTVIAGFLIDTFGRICFLRIGFGGIFLCTLFSASSQTYEMLAAAKLCEGVLFATSLAGMSALTSEFCHSTVRDRVMLCQSSYGALAQILSPAMAWGILKQDWRASFFGGRFVLNIWNFYLLTMSLWSLTAFLLYLLLPESPKFLVTQKRYIEAKNILVQIYTENSGKSADTFPYPHIFEKEIKEVDSQKAARGETKVKLRDKVMSGLKNMKPLLRRPLLGYIALLGLTQFIILGIL